MISETSDTTSAMIDVVASKPMVPPPAIFPINSLMKVQPPTIKDQPENHEFHMLICASDQAAAAKK